MRRGRPAVGRVARGPGAERGRARSTRRDWTEAYTGDGPLAMNSSGPTVSSRNGVDRRPRQIADAITAITGWLEEQGLWFRRRSPTSCATGCSAGSAIGASRSRSSTTRTVAPSRGARVDAAGRAAGPSPTYAPRVTRRRSTSRASGAPVGVARSEWVEVTLELDGCEWAGRARGAIKYTARDSTRCRSGPAPVGTTCATSTRPTRTRSSTPSVEHVLERRARVRNGEPSNGMRRPLRRRRRARRPAPPLRALLAQGAVRPRSRLHARAVPAAGTTRATSRHYAYVDQRGILRRRRRKSRRATAATSSSGEPVDRRVREDGQVA